MRFSGKLALRVGALGVAAAAIVVPATAAHAVAPSITVAPNTGLHDGDVVSVSGSNFANASTAFSIVECSDSNPGAHCVADCDVTPHTGGTTDASGNVPATNFTVHEGAIGSNGATCPPSASGGICFIAVSTDGGGADSAIAPITFVMPPSITAKPSTGVTDGQTIKVSGKHFLANKPVAIVSCSSATNSSKCDVGNVSLSGTTNASGSFKNDPLKVATTASGGKCKAGKTCFIVATTDIAGQGADKSQDAVTTIKLAKATQGSNEDVGQGGTRATSSAPSRPVARALPG